MDELKRSLDRAFNAGIASGYREAIRMGGAYFTCRCGNVGIIRRCAKTLEYKAIHNIAKNEPCTIKVPFCTNCRGKK